MSLKKIINYLLYSFFFFSFHSLSLASSPNAFSGYVPSEHIAIGNQIKLFFSANDPGKTMLPLLLPNGLTLTYGEIISIGDFYGVVGSPISLGKNEEERKTRFITAFNTFSQLSSSVNEVTQILNVIHNEQKLVEDAIQQGKNPEEIYEETSHDSNRQYNCITGGGCTGKVWWLKEGRYLKLLNENYDHFGVNALLAYQAGHEAAIDLALEGYQQHDSKKLEIAYEMNAFACHFLTDRFSSGHIRTPRIELVEHVTPSVAGSILANYMHNEEGSSGLHVHNQRGDHWITYGDGYYLNPNNSESISIMKEMLQSSVNNIFTAYQSGIVNADSAPDYIPYPDEVDNSHNRDDISPLFYWDNKINTLMRREDTTNYFDRHWTDNWWGWSTLILLSKERGLPDEAQAQLANSGYGEKALDDGLITNPAIIQYIKKKIK